MRKLGFAIKKVKSGSGEPYCVCNDGEWKSKLIDPRNYLKLFEPDDDGFVLFMSFDESGSFITLTKAIGGRGADNVSGWIYIPNNIVISGHEVKEVCDYVREELNKSRSDEFAIQKFFNKEYNAKEDRLVQCGQRTTNNSNQVRQYGVRYYEDAEALERLIGEGRNQLYYRKYKAVFLLKKDGRIKIAAEEKHKFEDLTEHPIEKYCTVKSPKIPYAKEWRDVSVILLMGEKPIEDGSKVEENEKLTLKLERRGFEPNLLGAALAKDVSHWDLRDKPITWKKKISLSMFSVKNHEGTELNSKYSRSCSSVGFNSEHLSISVNERQVTETGLLLSEKECENATVTVTYPKYEKATRTRNLLKKDSFKFTLDRKQEEEVIKVKIKGRIEEVTLKSKVKGIADSLLSKKYRKRDSVWLPDRMYKWIQRLIGLLCGLVFAAAAIAVLYMANIISGKPEGTQQTAPSDTTLSTQVTSNEVVPKQDSVLVAAIAYLAGNDKWEKGEMEKNHYLAGLFDDLNEYQFDKLKDRYEEQLKGIAKFKEIIDAGDGRVMPNTPYNKENDFVITVSRYIKELEKLEKQSTPNL